MTGSGTPDEVAKRRAIADAYIAWRLLQDYGRDDTTVCNVIGDDGLECSQEFPDELAWQEHYEDTHLGEDER